MIDSLDLHNLTGALLGKDDDEIEAAFDNGDEFDQELFDRFGVDLDQLGEIVEKLVPLAMIAKSPLTGKVFQGFGANGVWIVKQEINGGSHD